MKMPVVIMPVQLWVIFTPFLCFLNILQYSLIAEINLLFFHFETV